jgi:hypothetical protein
VNGAALQQKSSNVKCRMEFGTRLLKTAPPVPLLERDVSLHERLRFPNRL